MKLPINKSALVTGGTGFVGSHLVQILLKHGYSVTCLVRDRSKLRWLSGLDVRLVQGDCSYPDTLASAVRGNQIVFHAAGLTKARKTQDFFRVNHIGTRNVLQACALHNPGIEKFILVSSLAAGGPSLDGQPAKTTDAPQPVSEYGRSKLLAESEVLSYRDIFPVVILRPSAVYGPRDTDVFELFNMASRGFILNLAGGERYINPCYVEDLAQALFLAAEKKTRSGSVYCVAEERTYTLSAFREELLSSGGVHARTITVPFSLAYVIGLASEVISLFSTKTAVLSRQKIKEAAQKYWLCDHRAIRDDLGFQPQFPLARGLAITWQWYRENGWLK
jgi:nucleoside-diphosphate-sugar epimerase